MIKIKAPFSLDINVGDSAIQEAVSGEIEVNVYDDPGEGDEINRWVEQRGFSPSGLPYAVQEKMERLAIEEARKIALADKGERAISQHEDAQ